LTPLTPPCVLVVEDDEAMLKLVVMIAENQP